MLKNNSFEVLTSDGFKDFVGIKQSKNTNNLLIKTSKSEILVTPNHKFFDNGRFIYAKDLKIGGIISNQKIISIGENVEYGGVFYDLIEVEGGHHFTANNIEVSNCSYLEPKGWSDFLDGVMPSQSSLSFKKNIILSTPKGKNHFYDMWEAAGDTQEESANDYVRFLVDWKKVPRYKSDGTLYTPEEFERAQVKKYGQVYFNSAYACKFEGSDFTLIPGEILATYKSKEPIDLDIRGQLKIYENPAPNHKYIIGVDSSKEGQDFTGIQIFDCTELKFKQVASAKLQIDYLMVPEILDTYGRKYNSALIIIENNEGSGQSIADILARDYEYDNVFYEYRLFKGIRKRLGYPGFRTTKLTRDLMLQVVRMIATSGRLELCDSETLKEFETFTLVNGKYQANGPKAHDDLVMATLLCFAIFKDTKTFEDIQAIIDGLKTGESLDEGLVGLDVGFADFGEETDKDDTAYGLW